MPDRKADLTADAVRHFMGDRKIDRFYSDCSGEIERALRDLHIVSDTSQPGVPQNIAVAERLVQDILEGTRTALLRAGLPPCFWDIRMPTLLFDGKRLAWPRAGCGWR